jgi:hypothetical protein
MEMRQLITRLAIDFMFGPGADPQRWDKRAGNGVKYQNGVHPVAWILLHREGLRGIGYIDSGNEDMEGRRATMETRQRPMQQPRSDGALGYFIQFLIRRSYLDGNHFVRQRYGSEGEE